MVVWELLLFAEDWSWLGSDGSVGDGMNGTVSDSMDRCSSIGSRSVGLLNMGNSLVLHVGDEAMLVVGVVGDNLHTTVGELHTVLSW